MDLILILAFQCKEKGNACLVYLRLTDLMQNVSCGPG